MKATDFRFLWRLIVKAVEPEDGGSMYIRKQYYPHPHGAKIREQNQLKNRDYFSAND
jgi:hypothetical protein